MALTFDYKVRDRTGNLVEGQLEGDSLALVVGKLREMGYLPSAVTPKTGMNMKREITIPGFTNRVKLNEIAVATRQLATMIDSGLSVVRALGILAAQVENKELGRVLGEVRMEVERGSSLSARVHEAPQDLQHPVRDHGPGRRSRWASRRGPPRPRLHHGEAGCPAAQGQVGHDVPGHRPERDGRDLPGPAHLHRPGLPEALRCPCTPSCRSHPDRDRDLEDHPERVGVLVVAILVGGIFALRKWIKTEDGRLKWDAFKLKPPIFGQLVHKVALSRLSHTLGSLIQAGVPILESLDIVSDTAGNQVIGNVLLDAKAGVREGRALADTLRDHEEVIPALLTQMVEVGEQTGALDAMLHKVGDFYDGEVEITVNNLTSMLEPIMTVFMGAGVGVMVIAMYLPMFSYIKAVPTH